MRRRTLLGALPAAGLPAATRSAAKKLGANRNLFTGDSCVYFYNPELWHPEGLPYTAKAIHRFVDHLADNGVDTFLSNPNAQVAWYPSKQLQTILDGYKRGDRDFFRGHAEAVHVAPENLDKFLDDQVRFYNLYLDLAEAGVDWLLETTKACRRRGIAPWVSVRMNDTHGADNPEGSHFNAAIFKRKEFRLSGAAPDPADGIHRHWVALNYDKREVRDYFFSQIREAVEQYDFEGLELDWLRDPHCCEPQATQAQIDMMTQWIGEVRRLTDARAKALRKPYPVGMRIPGNLGWLKSRGLDVKAIVNAGHVDFLGFSNHWQTTWDMPYDELRRVLGPDVVFYGVVEDAPNWVKGHAPGLAKSAGSYPGLGNRYMAASAPMQHANAAGKLAMGVHGIEQFNFFCTDQPKIPGLRADYSSLRGTHDLDVLRGKPKHYCFSTPSGSASAAWELPEQLPVSLEPKQRRDLRLAMCGEPRGRLVVQVVVDAGSASSRIGVSFNGAWPEYGSQQTREMLFPVGPYTSHVAGHVAFNFPANVRDIRDGWNHITVINNSKQQAVKVVSVELGVFA